MGQQGTRKLKGRARSEGFLERHRASLVIVEGRAEGTEFELDRALVVVGRGPDVEVALEDSAISQHHAAFELTEHGFRVRDLASTNGTRVNGALVPAADLKHGDRIELGEHALQYLVEPRPLAPRTFEVA
jgi:pSer/pThr/pTyr-binding forkhead associated (FHA) protein